jgi:hypothetical protein
MTKIDVELDARRAVRFPNFGDGEVRDIRFRQPNVTLAVYAPVEDQTYEIDLEQVCFLSFTTDHVQNVIDRIELFQDTSSASELVRSKIPLQYRGVKKMVFVIVPIAGPDIISVCDQVTISRCERSF